MDNYDDLLLYFFEDVIKNTNNQNESSYIASTSFSIIISGNKHICDMINQFYKSIKKT